MNKFYAICGLYYEMEKYKGNEVFYGKQMFLGVEGEHKIYVYDEKLNDRSLVFKTKEQANKYIEDHKMNKNQMCTENHFVVTITEL